MKATRCYPACRRAAPLPLARRAIRSTSPITTTNGACRNTTTARFTKSWCSTASRPGCRGSRSCASARISAEPSTISIRRRSRATTPQESRTLMQDAGIVRNRAKIEGAVLSARAWLEDHGKGPGLFRSAVGFARRQAEDQQVQDHQAGPGRTTECRTRCRRSSQRAASNSSARPSSMPSCRRSAWSTTIW